MKYNKKKWVFKINPHQIIRNVFKALKKKSDFRERERERENLYGIWRSRKENWWKENGIVGRECRPYSSSLFFFNKSLIDFAEKEDANRFWVLAILTD